MRPWNEPQPVDVSAELRAAVGGHPLVSQALARRGFTSRAAALAFLDPDYYTPALPGELPGLAAAAARLEAAIRRRERICVWGDFDVDGQTATALLVSALRDLGAPVSFHIPVRANESHGVNLPVLQQVLDGGAELLLTCDTGIAANDAVAYAATRGVDVIITDHHVLPERLPEALALVNPRFLPGAHPAAALPGVGVAYKLAEELYRRAGRAEACDQYLDLAALGIVADLAVQTGETRYLLQRGLAVLRQARRLAVQAMLERAELNAAWLSEEHIGFVLAPRLNALGRLADANLAVEFLTTTDLGRARVLALQLEGLNDRRKLISNQVFQGTLAQLAREPALLEEPVLVLAHPAWPAGVIGIVASRLVERFNKPVVLISAPPGALGRGSARSVAGLDITAAIAEHQELLAGYGGHPLAAGLSIDPERIPEFRRRLSRTARRLVGDQPDQAALQLEGYLALPELSLDLVADLERLGPFGPGNPPLFLAARRLQLKSQAAVGREEEHLLLTVEDEAGDTQRVVWWQGAGWPLPEGWFDLAFQVRASTFRGERAVQVEWVDFRPLVEPAVRLQAKQPPQQVIDHRQAAHPLAVLHSILAQGEAQVWCEAGARQKLAGRSRNELSPAKVLVIWTTPPGRAELQAALEQARPETVYLFGVDPEAGQLESFLKRLAGLVKRVLHTNQGRASLPALAAATAQRAATVRKGLTWLEQRGLVQTEYREGDEVQFKPGRGEVVPVAAQTAGQVKAMLEETAAFRSYFRWADKEALIGHIDGFS